MHDLHRESVPRLQERSYRAGNVRFSGGVLIETNDIYLAHSHRYELLCGFKSQNGRT